MSQPRAIADFRPGAADSEAAQATVVDIPEPKGELDAGRELLTLIEQLRRNARDSRAQLHDVQRENDNLSHQLENALAELHISRSRESELRSRFVEITSIIKERDAAIAAGERYVSSITELQKRLDAATREHEAANRQRQEAAQRLASITQSADAVAAQLAQVQKQVISIRQARDTAQAQSRELTDKLARAEDEIAELGYARDAAQRAGEQSTAALNDLKREFESLRADRERLQQQVRTLSTELDANRVKILELGAEKAAAATIDSQLTEALAEARLQVATLTRERDAERAHRDEQALEVDGLREQIRELRAKSEASAGLPAELEEARRQIAALAAEKDARQARERELLQESASQQERLSSLVEELAVIQRGREDALAAAEAAQQKLQEAEQQRDAIAAQQTENALVLEAQFAAALTQNAELEKALAEATRRAEDASHSTETLRTQAAHSEEHRAEAIELAAQLDNARREIMELTAHLAEARLQVKSAKSAKPLKTKALAAAAVEPSAPEAIESDAAVAQIAAVEINEPFTEKEARSALTAMRRCFQEFQKTPTDTSLLIEIYSHAHGFAERARVSGLVGLHRLSAAFAELAQHLYRLPESVSPTTLRTVQQTIEFLTTLVRERCLTRLQDPAKARIYAVEDDIDNCQAITMALETAMLQTTVSQEPAIALAELASGRFDLVLLDVNLPGMDGFELCEQIRGLPLYRKTPIVFLTGANTLENRSQSAISGGNDFIAKPFNLHELSVKTLTLLLKAQLGIE